MDWDLGGEGEDGDRIPVEGRTIVVSNPPWGKRLTDDIDESWVSLKTFLRRECNGLEAWILSGNRDLTRILGMKKSRSVAIRTGDEDLRCIQYHIFKKKDVELGSFDGTAHSSSRRDDETSRQIPSRETTRRSSVPQITTSNSNDSERRMASSIRSRTAIPRAGAGKPVKPRAVPGKRAGPPTDTWD